MSLPSSIFDKERPVPMAQSYAEIKPILKWVYAWMLIGLIVTTAVAALTTTSPALVELRTNPIAAIGAMVVQIALVVALSWGIQRMSPSLAALMFVIYAGVLGFSLSLIFLVFDIGSIVTAFATTAILFGAMTMLGFTTDIDLSRFRNLFLMALFGLVIAIVVNMFLGSGPLNFLISIIGVIIFMGLTAYDTQNIKRMAAAPEVQGDSAVLAKMSIFGALSLYLNFINIFLFLLQIMGGGRD